MLLLIDIGNTHTHIAICGDKVHGPVNIPTALWRAGGAGLKVKRFIGKRKITGAAFCTVVPAAGKAATRWLATELECKVLHLTHKTVRGVGIRYPNPKSIGPDRLANAIAVRSLYDGPAVVVDFGTAVTFDVVDRSGDYIGGIIAPGLSAMTDYLHEKTALLPRITIRDTTRVIGKSTKEAMLIGAVQGYRGLIRELIRALKSELGAKRLPVVATGGCAALLARNMPEITKVDPLLTLRGLKIAWELHFGTPSSRSPAPRARAKASP